MATLENYEADESARVFTMLENNPTVMTDLAHRLGLSKDLAFHDVYSLYDEDMLAFIPRPVFALLVTIPLTEAWRQVRDAEDASRDWYDGAGPEEPVVWFRQTIVHGCGLIGLLHCAMNGVPAEMIAAGSTLAEVLAKAVPLKMKERAQLLNDTEALWEASEAAAVKGDTKPLEITGRSGNHFVALVKGRDGHLWELEGSRKGPLDRGILGSDEDALSEHALQLGMKKLIELQRADDGNIRFSCIALAPSFG